MRKAKPATYEIHVPAAMMYQFYIGKLFTVGTYPAQKKAKCVKVNSATNTINYTLVN